MNKKILSLINQNNILFALAMIGYVCFSVFIISKRIPFFDEVNAWNISQNCSFCELFKVSRIEGHFILWYLLLKPLSLYNIGFPTSMYLLNYFFCFCALCVLWIKSPFNPWLKFILTFSLPIQMFTAYARCYTLGVLFLFSVCAIYPKRKTHLILYPLFIMLLANTSVIACVAAFCFGLLYCYELLIDLEKKQIAGKDLLKPFAVFSLGSIFMLLQIFDFEIPYYSTSSDYLLYKFKGFFNWSDYWPRNFANALQVLMLLSGFWYFRADKKPYVFLLLSTALLLLIAVKVYTLEAWHYMFLFLFFVCAMWIYGQNHQLKTNLQKIYYVLFWILSALWVFYFKFPWHWNSCYTAPAKHILKNMEEYAGSKIFLFPVETCMLGIVPMLRDYDIEFYNAHGLAYTSCESYIKQWRQERIDFQKIKEEYLSDPEKKDKSFIMLPKSGTNANEREAFMRLYNQGNHGVGVKLYRQTFDIIVYQIFAE